MLIEISKEDSIFDSRPFIDEEVSFSGIYSIREEGSSAFFTNKNKSIVIAQSTPGLPDWIWTRSDISSEEMKELKEDFYELYKNTNKLCFVAKPNIVTILADHYSKRTQLKYDVDFEMEAYECRNIVEPKTVNDFIRKAHIDDIETISELLAEFSYDCFGIKTSPQSMAKTAKSYIEKENLYLWCNDEQIISTTNITLRTLRHARISQVYTRRDMRGQGFGTRIVAEVCEIILKENRIPVLYADLANPSSNKAYKKVGFTECGKVSRVTFSE